MTFGYKSERERIGILYNMPVPAPAFSIRFSPTTMFRHGIKKIVAEAHAIDCEDCRQSKARELGVAVLAENEWLRLTQA
ncbi:MAG: hypothetical protein E8A46_22325 [Bradyrhizobium sp.]|uniref:hypothetical protein n=1 Tax=Bradyrhizobium sp. TaxID=376 RepID=UPI00121D622B|nr:hypothetical protein [Bradyrhizobium sp.]THD48525.1 MAG: hypothetical protein E8A46_22325 [Bradyrhizobium sp.]